MIAIQKATGTGTPNEALHRARHHGLATGNTAARSRTGAGEAIQDDRRASSSLSVSSSFSNGSMCIPYLSIHRQSPSQALARPMQAGLYGSYFTVHWLPRLLPRDPL